MYSMFWLFDPLTVMLGPSHKPKIDQTGEFQEPAAENAEVSCCLWFTGGTARPHTRPSADGSRSLATAPLEEPLLGSSDIREGAVVKVRSGQKLKAFKDEEGTPRTELDPEQEGAVEKIDAYGHALVAFEPTKGYLLCDLLFGGAAVRHWVSKGELPKLWVIKPAPLEPAPRPTAVETVNIIQKYFQLKTNINFITGLAYFCLFYILRVDLMFVLVLIAFFLGFIPEFGFIAQVVVSLPVVLLSPVDPAGHLESSHALWNLKWFALGSLAIKLAVNNVLETIIMKKDKVLSQGGAEVHPVLILFVLALGGEIWGAVGMLLAVPGISLGRLMLRLAVDTIRSREVAESD